LNQQGRSQSARKLRLPSLWLKLWQCPCSNAWDIGQVIKGIVHDEEHFPDYQIPKKPRAETSAGVESAAAKITTGDGGV